MTSADRNDWIDANRQLLLAEFARLTALLGSDAGSDGVEEATRAVMEFRNGLTDGPPAIDILVETFGLSEFEKDLLLLTAGVEMDGKLARACAEAMGTPQRPRASFGLALSVLPGAHWSALSPVGPLRHWRLLEVQEGAELTSARLRIDERILHQLAGIHYVDTRLQPLLSPVDPPAIMSLGQKRTSRAILEAVRREEESSPLVSLSGDDPDGQEDVAASVARALGATLYAASSDDLPTDLQELEVLAVLWDREAALSGRVILIREIGDGSSRITRRFVEKLGSLCFRMGSTPGLGLRREIRFAVNRPEAPEQREIWRATLGAPAARLDGSLDRISSQYRLSARSISDTARRLAPRLEETHEGESIPWPELLRPGPAPLTDMAHRIEPVAEWRDLVLPRTQKAILRDIVSHVRHRLRVYHDWGFAARSSRGLGIGALFCGESGTGKTMAAEVMAGELELELYRIDLSAVVSKYIGETEKNLRKVFDAAEESGAILLFDEADALFGKRSEVKDSHDRYANIEISYLLQRMEAYRGLAILTTNLRDALDTAFQRRLRFVVQFPFPDAAHREAIWRGIFPESTPLDGIDFEKLARLNVAGGSIRNIALNAAFSAAAEDGPVGMRHLLLAARAEAAKRERSLTEAETRGWV